MTDITKALSELPPMPTRENCDRLQVMFPDNAVIIASAIARFSQDEADALRARLALAERLLQENSQLVTGEWQCAKDARAYLQFRAKEQQT